MGLKSKLKKQLIKRALEYLVKGDYRIKRIVYLLGLVVLSLGLVVSLILYYSVSKITVWFSEKPDPDLVALEHLTHTRKIVLTTDQKQHLLPIVQDIIKNDNNPIKERKLKNQLEEVLTEEQLKTILSWKNNPGLPELVQPYASDVVSLVSKDSALPSGIINKGLYSVGIWWNLERPRPEGFPKLIRQLNQL